MNKTVLVFASLLLLGFALCVGAHDVRPAYLQLHQTSADTYDVLWKVPALGNDMRLSVYVELPKDCSNLTEPRGFFSPGSYTERWSVKRPGGLAGATIRIDGLSSTITDVLVRVERMDGSQQVARLTPSDPSFIVEAAPNALGVVRAYLPLGIKHILTGPDHLLFVLGLLLLVSGFKRLVKTITAFTVAHSVTLTLATLGFVHIPPPPVETMIALSIVFVAREVIKQRQGIPSLAQKQPWLVAFSFGLMHGLGFAGGLTAAGLPPQHIPLALLFFSMGVEIGHFSFVGLVLSLRALLRRTDFSWPTWAWRVSPYAIGGLAAFWVIQRIAAF
jgi:hydrogenase/urease accessory protein HupE